MFNFSWIKEKLDQWLFIGVRVIFLVYVDNFIYMRN